MMITSRLTAALALFLLSTAPLSLRGQASLAPHPSPSAPGGGEAAGGLEGADMLNRAAVGVGGGIAAYHGIKVVGGAARSVAASAPVVKDIPVYGSHVAKVPVIGAAVVKTNIPTTLGQAPFVGKAISSIPVVGPVVAGPPHPILVGAVAVDTYVLPRYAPCGWTESALFTNTDFNSEPYLRQYVNYLAPLPYTHPPIYAPGPMSPGTVQTIPLESPVSAAAAAQGALKTVRIEY